jgi:sortase (surface protein transpeptidase)
MRTLLKIALFISISIALYFSINIFFYSSNALDLYNTFIPSQENYDYLNYSTADVSTGNAAKKFDEYNESTIDPNQFYLRIDKIKLFKKVVKDVDPRYQDVYVKSWESGISHGKFTSYPDQIGITYLFAHAVSNPQNALNENAWFTFMDKLSMNDQVIIYYQGKKYTYEVSAIKVVSPEATGFYTGAAPVSMVRMQYCGPPTGSLNSRTLVDAILIDSVSI